MCLFAMVLANSSVGVRQHFSLASVQMLHVLLECPVSIHLSLLLAFCTTLVYFTSEDKRLRKKDMFFANSGEATDIGGLVGRCKAVPA